MPINRELIDSIVDGKEDLVQPKDTIPSDLLQFAPKDTSASDPISFWANVDVSRLDKFLTYTQDDLTPDVLEFHKLVAHHANLVLPFLERRYELENRNPNYNKIDHTYWHSTYQIVKRISSSVHPEAATIKLMIEIAPPRRKGQGKKGSDEEANNRKPPQMPMRIALPFLEALNGLFIQEFDETELSYLFHQLTGYSKTNMSKYRKAGLSPVDREDLLEALEGIIRSIKGS